MIPRFPRARTPALALLLSLATSCSAARNADVAAFDAAGSPVVLRAADARSAAGKLSLDMPGKLRFSFAAPLPVNAAAIELEYALDANDAGLLLVFRAPGEDAWALPSIAQAEGGPADRADPAASPSAASPSAASPAAPCVSVLRYRVPLGSAALASFELSAEYPAGAAKAPKPKAQEGRPVPVFALRSIRVAERAYGYAALSGALFLTPYVYREPGAAGLRLVIDPPARHRPGSPDLRLGLGGGRSTLAAGDVSFAYPGPRKEGTAPVNFPAGVLPLDPFPLVVEGPAYPAFALTERPAVRAFPSEPVPADPGLILAYRQDAWRDARYEVFRWERFPSILIFDTADYGVQDRLFKRIAFFTEKAGYRGRLATDAEIASLHGWNAHDYRAEDLAAFFERARLTEFGLNAEERELLLILAANGIVKRDGETIAAGEGAIVSISRESEGYLRGLFMTHEAYHGLFFIDADFRRFAASRWDGLDPVARRFLKAYFDMHRYDVGDRNLMMNELMAYCLQQPAASAAKYFGETLASRLEKDAYRKGALPPKDEAKGSWPDLARLFTAEAEAFDDYVAGRWALRAGSVASVYQISRTNAAR